MKRKMYLFLSVFILSVFSGMQSLMAQCAMCRVTLENNVSNGEPSVAAGINSGILYLFAAPYLVISVVAFLWYKKSKENAQKKQTRVNPSW
jgi:hypothetical protein